MKKSVNIIAIIPLLFLFYSCDSTKTKTASVSTDNSVCVVANDCQIPTVYDIYNFFYDKNIDSISSYLNYTIIDTVFVDDEDSGAKWKGKWFFLNNKKSFLVESSWISDKVSRITITDSLISISKETKIIGNTVSAILDYVSSTLPNVPDGYIAFSDKHNPKIQYFIINDKLREEGFWVTDISEIPKNLIITEIIIFPVKTDL